MASCTSPQALGQRLAGLTGDDLADLLFASARISPHGGGWLPGRAEACAARAGNAARPLPRRDRARWRANRGFADHLAGIRRIERADGRSPFRPRPLAVNIVHCFSRKCHRVFLFIYSNRYVEHVFYLIYPIAVNKPARRVGGQQLVACLWKHETDRWNPQTNQRQFIGTF